MKRNIISAITIRIACLSIAFLGAATFVQAQKKKAAAPVVQADNTLTPANIQKALDEAYDKFKDIKEGKNADYIKELAKVDPNIYGIAIVTTDGTIYTKGDLQSAVSIQSISKVFTMARVIEEQGPRAIMDKIGVDATGMRFNSIVAVELQKGKEINPLVNPGAIAASSLVAGADSAAKWKSILQTHSDFAGRPLSLDMPVYISEAGDNLRNQAIAHLLFAYGRMYFDPVQATDIYTKQCAISVNAKDLAIMAATLANGGLNPITKKVVVKPETVKYTLPVMATAGLYDDAGQWLFATGLPGKSGVGGGIIAVVPGKFGIAVISPPLSPAGNSVKAIYTIRYIIDALGVNPYLIKPKQ
ncbi:glutaminase A [Flavihumibacter profundi]|uniref:glutaminase A n=1 Tax=Flavihumibacter profundi TaxID=2716883 RepID=UPI001CC66138|nr:glutaminase A [Flavihumibacter profundi]MBZ5859026.1 glutaminase A [Flavihumibacter profundi]